MTPKQIEQRAADIDAYNEAYDTQLAPIYEAMQAPELGQQAAANLQKMRETNPDLYRNIGRSIAEGLEARLKWDYETHMGLPEVTNAEIYLTRLEQELKDLRRPLREKAAKVERRMDIAFAQRGMQKAASHRVRVNRNGPTSAGLPTLGKR